MNFRFKCDDSFDKFGQLSGCKESYSQWAMLDKINTSTSQYVIFEDNLQNKGNTQCDIKKILIDKQNPEIDIKLDVNDDLI